MFAFAAMEAASKALQRGHRIAVVFEHPEDLGSHSLGTPASVFQLERLRWIVKILAWNAFAFHQCDFKALSSKPDPLDHERRRSVVFIQRLEVLQAQTDLENLKESSMPILAGPEAAEAEEADFSDMEADTEQMPAARKRTHQEGRDNASAPPQRLSASFCGSVPRSLLQHRRRGRASSIRGSSGDSPATSSTGTAIVGSCVAHPQGHRTLGTLPQRTGPLLLGKLSS